MLLKVYIIIADQNSGPEDLKHLAARLSEVRYTFAFCGELIAGRHAGVLMNIHTYFSAEGGAGQGLVAAKFSLFELA